ncbi:uncharacterized protein A4U43_C04F17370 [Asparagus officinalis]|uniref:Prolamin-like domain-containing protein n=1 Tax=Asparagus officinalis TaxID=4686 RepID=A0A5P1F4A2_ASPOF|nr:uncharacterized protein A4U43_C04F17090 [Asparagus officinalis]ONK72247.1 uncharacterized protein A4U43_C04F17370 [Asparagus officinalis]
MQILLFLLLALLSISISPSKSFLVLPKQQRGEARWTFLRPRNVQPGSSEYRFPLGILPSPMITDPAYRECWKSFRSLPGCTPSMLLSSRKNTIDIKPDCCDAVRRLKPDCFYKIFYTDPFKANFGPDVKTYCAVKH